MFARQLPGNNLVYHQRAVPALVSWRGPTFSRHRCVASRPRVAYDTERTHGLRDLEQDNNTSLAEINADNDA